MSFLSADGDLCGKRIVYLVSLVIVLRVVLEHLGLLGVLESVDEVVSAKFFAPLLIVDEPSQNMSATPEDCTREDRHLFAELDVELARSQEPQ
jgi:hypothetical protein